MTKMEAQLTIPRSLLELINSDKWLVRDHLEPAMRRCVPLLKFTMIKHLPDGRASGTRALQSAKARERFPFHMKDHVASKQVKDPTGVLQMVGLTRKAQHAHFDHGEKALKGVGRKHVLWGSYDTSRTKPPLLRRQQYDVKALTIAEAGPRCQQIIVESITRAIDRQMKK